MTPRAWLLFGAVSLVWGVPYFFIKVAVEDGVPPAFVAWSRVALAAVILLPVAARRGALRGLGGRWPAIGAYAAYVVSQGSDLLVMGAHGHAGMKDWIYGATINHVRHELKIPVLVVNV